MIEHISFLALIQGITEFLPISSSAHLILFSHITQLPYQGVYVDVVLHAGTLAAVVVYFFKDLYGMCSRALQKDRESYMFIGALLVATLPIVIVGLIFHMHIELLRHPLLIAFTTIVFALLLYVAEYQMKNNDRTTITITKAWYIGCAQILALIPGVSRSGICITAGIFGGLSKKQAAQFSFLLAIPVISAAFIFQTTQAMGTALTMSVEMLFFGFILTFVVAYAVIHYFIAYINTIGFLPFVLYRIILGSAILFYYFTM